MSRTLAIDLDGALGDTRPLWRDFLADASRRFAAIAPLCGGGDDKQASLLKNLPIWAVHGEMDSAVPVNRTRRMIKSIENAGGKPKYTELAGVGHNCWSKAYAPEFGLLDWLFEQKRT